MVRCKPTDRREGLRFWGSDGRKHSLEDFRGQNVLICFFDQDSSIESKHEAKFLRDHRRDFCRSNAMVVGVSADPVATHQRFVSDFGFPGLLLSDPEGRLKKALGSEGTASNETLLVDKHGKLSKRWRGRVGEVLDEEELLTALASHSLLR